MEKATISSFTDSVLFDAVSMCYQHAVHTLGNIQLDMHYSYFRGGSLASPDGGPRDQMVSGFSISAPLPDVPGYSCSGLGGSGTRHA